MKSRELHTTPVLIVTDYRVIPHKDGKSLHTFTPESTSTIYQFIANREPLLEEGQRYNVGYNTDKGVNWVDMSATAKADDVDKDKSYYVSKLLGKEICAAEKNKSDTRVKHKAKSGYYLGKKYAWRIYGMAVGRDTFDSYLVAIGHPTINCLTDDSPSIAYLEKGLLSAMDALISSATHKDGNRFSSPLLPSKKWFQIKGLAAITDKK